jgi:hypothetical protein
MELHRGEKNTAHPAPKHRLVSGMTMWQPWVCKSTEDLWTELKKDIQKQAMGNISSYAFYLRKEGRPYALATARTSKGAFTYDYNYILKIKNVRTYYWTKDGELGKPAPFTTPEAVTEDYIVLNAETIKDSTILGFGHFTDTKEVTFFNDLPIECVISCNQVELAKLDVVEKAKLTQLEILEHKIQKLIR